MTDVSQAAGEPFLPLHLGRGLAVGDLDNDGRLDAVVVAQNEPSDLPPQSDRRRARHFVAFSLEGTRSNRDAVGARVTITAGGRRRSAQHFGGGSYQSASDPRVHFGLGEATIVDLVEIRWPSGHVDRHAGTGRPIVTTSCVRVTPPSRSAAGIHPAAKHQRSLRLTRMK